MVCMEGDRKRNKMQVEKAQDLNHSAKDDRAGYNGYRYPGEKEMQERQNTACFDLKHNVKVTIINSALHTTNNQ